MTENKDMRKLTEEELSQVSGGEMDFLIVTGGGKSLTMPLVHIPEK